MSITIHTGSDKCKVLTLLECPACGDSFDIADGRYVSSATLDDRVLVCGKHDTDSLTVEQEICVQTALKFAIDCRRGYVSNGKSTLKKSELMMKYGTDT